VLAPGIALLALVLIVQQTVSALRSSGAWRDRPKASAIRNDPYAHIDEMLGRPLLDPSSGQGRDPFGYAPPPTVAVRPGPSHTPVVVVPPPPPRPTLTSIIFDNDPRATVRYNDRDFSVRENSLFADFRVRSITSTQVILERNGEPLVLTLRPKGE
jgi:hypothetical protein